MDKNILEFLGMALLNAAKSQKQLEEINKNIEKITADNPFMKLFLNSFGWQTKEKEKDIILEFVEKSSEAQKEFIKALLTMFNVVTKEEYLALVKENNELKVKIDELEKIIQCYKNVTEKEIYSPGKVMENLTQIMTNQTQQFKELMKKINQPDKKTKTKTINDKK